MMNRPLVVSTWKFGKAANEAAWEVLTKKGRALDAVEAGVRVTEADPEVVDVGYGGLPDRDGNVTLDAAIMDHQGRCGSVVYLKGIKHPVSVARLVMEKTPHVILAADGAQKLALAHGFKEENLLTEKARQEWEKWKRGGKEPKIDKDNHDTIGMLAIDHEGHLAAACTTSGLKWRHDGRLADSGIIGSGLFVDQEVGAATATGNGDAILRTVGSFLIIEQMRMGRTPQQACDEAMRRLIKLHPDYESFQVAFLAISKKGEIGTTCLQDDYYYARCDIRGNELIHPPCIVKKEG